MIRKCKTPYCRNTVKGIKYCSTCTSRRCRERHPMKYAYNTTKANAKRRHKIFGLTFEEFKEFCYETFYMKNKGKTATSFSIDCIINELGYVHGNIRAIPLSENSKKGTKILVYDWQTKEARYVTNDYHSEKDQEPDYF